MKIKVNYEDTDNMYRAWGKEIHLDRKYYFFEGGIPYLRKLFFPAEILP